MGRWIRSTGTSLALLALTLPACGDDGGGGGGDTETGTGTGTGTGTSTPTTMSTTASMTTASMTGGMDSSTGTPDDTTAGPSDSTGTSADTGMMTTGGMLSCEECGLAACGDEIATCLGDEDCACWLSCLNEGGSNMECGQECMGPPPKTLDPVGQCIEMNCAEECAMGGTTGDTGATTGGMSDGAYEECAGDKECPEGIECNMFLNYCAPGCQNDGDCPAGPGGETASCSQFGDCVLECQDDGDCPGGMNCNQFDICVFQ